ncbi:hypothetical protein FDP41_002800 [Naegleria fowleri]|uniref:TIP41-like protein n=1 Tax=Naegleria fowleri TaxID=5763 RepID=A0A6A5BY43_NAEFO|nr:uncharacterized protein FDP41_002800 [Naegleria fowleri]KAF0978285.1 hypothetical protein FDP41_002800 [Naegleria fowleri]CAG4710606.1 unnamed protein product [Naegleria fowleri]
MTTRFPTTTNNLSSSNSTPFRVPFPSSSSSSTSRPSYQIGVSNFSSTTNATPQHDTFQINDWKFDTLKTPILNQTESDELKEELKIFAIPEQTFNSYLTITNTSNGFEYHFNTRDALLYAKNEAIDQCAHIQKIKVNCHETWMNKKIPNSNDQLNDVNERDDGIDWTFTTLYKGSVPTSSDESEIPSCSIVPTKTHKIDYDLLKRKDDPILFYDEIVLFEDELHDHGVSHLTVKIRVMNHSFYVLMRFFLRVDGVCIRCIDTRLFHKFGQNYLLREFSIRESSWKDLMNNHAFNAQYNMDQTVIGNPNVLAPILTLKEENTDLIQLNRIDTTIVASSDQ